ncbi:MAG: hypothetical protein R2722_08715 [Tessaracoccus sp.]
MSQNAVNTRSARLTAAFENPDPSVRLNIALAAGTHPEAGDVEVLIARCAVEPDFGVGKEIFETGADPFRGTPERSASTSLIGVLRGWGLRTAHR